MNFTVYRSSAGSGKTYSLVKEYLGIVLKHPTSYKNVLAITFTNKAANEMRERIIDALKDLSEPEDHPDSGNIKYMLPELIEKTALVTEDLIKNANIVLTNILHNYQEFSVTTIDSFIHRIIRTFAFDLHLPLNFEVETDEKSMVSMAVDLLLSRVGVEETPTKVLRAYTESRISEEKNWDIENELKRFSRRLLKDDIADFLDDIHKMESAALLSLGRKLNDGIRDFEKEIIRKAKGLLTYWQENEIEGTDLYYGKGGIFGYVSRLAEGNLKTLEPSARIKTKTLGEGIWYSDKLERAKKMHIDSHIGMMIDLSNDVISYIESELPLITLYRLLKRNIFPIAVLNEIENLVEQIKHNEGIIHISEFDKRIAEIVHNEPVPFIYERLGEKYKHFLIDEFQDTSVLEWQNILPLIENSLSEGHFNMIVGDAKQAIYRFKGGEVEQLVDLPSIHKKPDTPEMDSREKMLHSNFHLEPLNINFRSHKGIVDFNNDLYEHVSAILPAPLKDVYEGSWQDHDAKKSGGEVFIEFIKEEGKKDDREPVYFNKIYQNIESLVMEQDYEYSDIAVLCRSNANASHIARYLLLQGINVISSESLLIASSPEVNFLIFCFDYILNPDDRLALSGMLTYLAKKDDLRVQDLLGGIEKDEEGLKTDKLKEIFTEYINVRKLAFNHDSLKQMGLYERLEALIRMFGLDETPDPYIVFFMDVVYDFSLQNRYAMEDFTSFWRDNSQNYSIRVPEGMNAVNVMTIHKAKGLEFPVVIYPFANTDVSISKDQKWVSIDEPSLPDLSVALLPMVKDLESTGLKEVYNDELEKASLDMLNILYVATTRPTERLYIYCDLPSEKAQALQSIPALLRSFLLSKQEWEVDRLVYHFGKGGRIEKIEKRIDPPVIPSTFISSDWRDQIMLSGNADEFWDLNDENNNRAWGNTIHSILARVKKYEDLDRVINDVVQQGILHKQHGKHIFNLLSEMMEKEELQQFFDGRYEVRNEASIMDTNGSEYRPDRLMINEDQVIVLDYKTGKEELKHKTQLENYARLLNEIGFARVDKFLLYINEEYKLMKL